MPRIARRRTNGVTSRLSSPSTTSTTQRSVQRSSPVSGASQFTPVRRWPKARDVLKAVFGSLLFKIVAVLVLSFAAIMFVWWYTHDPFRQVSSDRQVMLEAWSDCVAAFTPIHSPLASYDSELHEPSFLLDAGEQFRTHGPAFSKSLRDYRKAAISFRRSCDRAAKAYERIASKHHRDETLTLVASEVRMEGLCANNHADEVMNVWNDLEQSFEQLLAVTSGVSHTPDYTTGLPSPGAKRRAAPGELYHHADLSAAYRSLSFIADDVRRLRTLLVFDSSPVKGNL